jgi:hypothetical protein
MSLQTAAVILSVTGGLAELVGLGMVIRGIGADRERAAKLIAKTRNLRTPRREYPPKVPVPMGSATPGERATRPGRTTDIYDIRAQSNRAIAQVANLIRDVKIAVDKERDKGEVRLLKEIDQGDDELRKSFREVLESDLTERWIGVAALFVGILLAATGSVLGSLS